MKGLWESFLPLGTSRRQDEPSLNAVWLAAHGFAPEAPLVLHALRERVIPLVRQLQRARNISWFSVLLHDRSSGVPMTPEDTGAYVHFRFVSAQRAPVLPREWLWTRRTKLDAIGGLDGVRIDRAFALFGAQMAWLFDVVEACGGLSEEKAIGIVRQYFHFFANMAQVEVA